DNIVSVKEWIWKKGSNYNYPDLVNILSLDESVLPIERLWFGNTGDDIVDRMKTFLFCMKCDSKLILNLSYVPKHLIIFCCVLRYIITHPNGPVLYKEEFDCFLAQAVSNTLLNPSFNHNIEITELTVRGLLLASFFMHGVEHAIFVNEVCGLPIPPAMYYPFLFFDGKRFQDKLSKINKVKDIVELCDGNLSEVAVLEKLRTAILDGLNVRFAFPLLKRTKSEMSKEYFENKEKFIPAGYSLNLGGELKVAGTVVGKWAPNIKKKVPYCRGNPVQTDKSTSLRKVGRCFKTEKQNCQQKRTNYMYSNKEVDRGFGQLLKNKREKKLGNNIADGMIKMNLGLGRGCTVETKSKVLPVGQFKLDSDDSDSESNEITGEGNEREIFSAKEENPTTRTEEEEEGDDGDLIPQFTLNSYLSLKTEN
ncbi:constitutive coactivator of PPAR-gamma-like protein 2, partial [Centruroides vittatus]